MIALGYNRKIVSMKPDWLKVECVRDIYSVSSCVSQDFCEVMTYWKNNGYWFYNSPDDIVALANDNSIDLSNTQLFYYESYEKEFDLDNQKWTRFEIEESFPTNVTVPANKKTSWL